MMRYLAAFVGIILLGLAFYTPSKAKNDALYIVATTAQVADIAKNIQSEHMRIESLMGTGVDPHLYRPTRSDTVKLMKADIILYNGFHLEGQMVELLETLKKEKTVISMSDALSEEQRLTADNQYDPHIWMNPQNWIAATTLVKQTFIEKDEQNKALYEEKAHDYIKQLQTLHQEIADMISTIPQNTRTMITAHDAFGYFGNTYGLNVIGIQGLSTESEAGLKRMEELSTLLSQQKIPAIFSETSVNDQNIKALIAGAKSKGHTVELGAALFSDAMGPKDSDEGTYIGMMKHNARTITSALGGHVKTPTTAQRTTTP